MKSEFDYPFIKRVGDLTADGVAVYDAENKKFIYANKNFLDIFRVKHKTLTSDSSTVLRYLYTEDMDYLKARTHELFHTGAITTTEFRLKMPGNVTRHLSCDVIVLNNKKVITAFVKDVSQIKTHEDFLIKYTAQKDIMLDMLTHNLSGPLQLSKDVISSLQKGYSENDMAAVSKLICIMRENTQQCIDIVNDFLKEEHFESSNTKVRKTRFDVIEKIRIMIEKLKEINRDKNFILHTSMENFLVNSDPVKFFQAIHNILSNSIKFTPADGNIEITVKRDKKFYVVEIKDNGIGIPEKMHEKIFKYKIEGRTGLKGEKSKGLGLSIARRLINIMGGKIWFESAENKGTTFFVKLPRE